MANKKYYELDEEDFWDGDRYYLTDGVNFISKKEFLGFKKQRKIVYVVSDDDNIFDLEFEVI